MLDNGEGTRLKKSLRRFIYDTLNQQHNLKKKPVSARPTWGARAAYEITQNLILLNRIHKHRAKLLLQTHSQGTGGDTAQHVLTPQRLDHD